MTSDNPDGMAPVPERAAAQGDDASLATLRI
jgi:hypothetical protein